MDVRQHLRAVRKPACPSRSDTPIALVWLCKHARDQSQSTHQCCLGDWEDPGEEYMSERLCRGHLPVWERCGSCDLCVAHLLGRRAEVKQDITFDKERENPEKIIRGYDASLPCFRQD